jgi:hypothetical protein
MNRHTGELIYRHTGTPDRRAPNYRHTGTPDRRESGYLDRWVASQSTDSSIQTRREYIHVGSTLASMPATVWIEDSVL